MCSLTHYAAVKRAATPLQSLPGYTTRDKSPAVSPAHNYTAFKYLIVIWWGKKRGGGNDLYSE